MKKKKDNDYTIFLLVAAGLGIYWFMYRKAKMPPATTLPVDQVPISNKPVADYYDVKYTINGMRRLSSVPNTI
jgi:hypothetical protein